jgi:hypothetical protein
MSTDRSTHPLASLNIRRGSAAMVGAIALSTFGLASAGTAAAAAPAVNANVGNGTLHISGTPHADRITLRLSPRDPNQLEVDARDNGSADFSFDRSTFVAIDVAAGNGDDTIKIDERNGAFTTTGRLSSVGTATTPSSVAVVPSSSSADEATTSPTRTVAPTRRSSARGTTRSSGIRAMPPTPSKVRAARMPSSSTVPAATSSWQPRPTVAGCCSPAISAAS